MPVVITPGGFESETNGRWHVPRRDLLDGVRIAFEGEKIAISDAIPGLSTLVEELENMRVHKSSGRKHDDLVLALSLAWWRASREAGRTA